METRRSEEYPQLDQPGKVIHPGKTRLLEELHKTVASGISIDEIFSMVSTELEGAVNFDSVGVALLDHSGEHYSIIMRSGKKEIEDSKLNVIPLKGTAAEWVLKNKKPLARGDLTRSKWSHVEDILLKEGIRSDVLLPLISRDEAIGLLMLGRCKAVAFTDEELKVLENLASQISTAFDSLALFGQLKKKTERLDKLLRLSRKVASALKSEEVYEKIVKAVGELLAVPRVLLFIHDEKTGDLIVKASLELDELVKKGHNPKLKIGQGITGWVAENKKLAVVAEITKDPRFFNIGIVVEAGLVSCACVPLILGDKVLGVLQVLSTERRIFTEQEVELLQFFANHAAIALENSKLYETALENKGHLQCILDHAAVAIISDNVERGVVEFSPGAELLTGYSKHEIVGQTLEGIYADDAHRQKMFKEVMTKGSIENFETKWRKKDGSIIDVAISLSQLKDSHGQVIGLVSVTKDVTAHKLAQEQLRQAEAKYRTLVEQIPAVTYMAACDETGTAIYISPHIKPLLGFSQAEWLGSSKLWAKQIHADDRERVLAEAAHCRASGEPFRSEYRMLARDGRVVWVRDEAVVMRDSDGRPLCLHGVVFDLTERKRADDLLRQSEEKYRTLFEESKDVISISTPEGKFLDINPAGVELFGYSSKEELLRINIARDLYFNSKDRDAYIRLIAQQGFVKDFKLTFKRKDGRPVIVLETSTVVRDDKGNIIAYRAIVKDITERQRAEEQLRESEEKYRTLFEESKDAVFISTPQGKFLDINPAGMELLGFASKEELLKVDIARDVYSNPKNRQVFVKAIAKQGFVKDFENTLKRRDGQPVIILATATALRDKKEQIIAYHGILRDVTQQKIMQQQLLEAHESVLEAKSYLQCILDSSKDAVIACDTERRCVEFSRGAEDLTGYKKIEMAGRTKDVLYLDQAQRELMLKELKAKGSVDYFETKWRKKDGSIIDVAISLSQLKDTHGKVIGFVGIAKDITEHKTLEEEINETNSALVEVNQKLQKTIRQLQAAQEQMIRFEKMVSLGRLAAGVAHEILNPLNIIYMLAQMALEDWLNDELKNSFDTIKEQCIRIERIVESLKHFAREKKPEKSFVDLNELLDQTLVLVEKPMLYENIKIKKKYQAALSTLPVDRDQMIQAFINIITNAMDAMSGGGELTLSTALVKRNGKRMAKISFSDTGCGIEKEILPKIFDPFFTTKSAEKGTGLGLSICQGIVEGHGGSIEVKSQVGKGTSFIIYLPV